MKQYGFFIDQSRCIGCNTCTVACKQSHDIPPNSVKWMRVYQWEKGIFPNARLHILPIMCLHCKNPICIKACTDNAIYKEQKYGAVLVDADRCECQGTRKCWQACPYGAPQFDGDGPGKMSKCNMCIERLEQGLKPICVLSCSMRALEFGLLEELENKYGNLKRLEDMPKESITEPSVVFKAIDPKQDIIPWNPVEALHLWQKRQHHEGQPLPDVIANISDVTGVSHKIVGRNKLVLKAKNCQELMYYTTDNE